MRLRFERKLDEKLNKLVSEICSTYTPNRKETKVEQKGN